MPDRIVSVDGVEHHFPGNATDDEISSALSGPAKPSTGGRGLALAATGVAAGPAVAGAANLAERFATSPTAAKVGGALVRGGTTLAGVIHGAMTGNIPEVILSPLAGWKLGKGGYWLTKAAQSVAGPVATGLEKAAPFVKTMGPLMGSFGAEGDALQQLNTPENLSVFSKMATPAQQSNVADLIHKHDSQEPAMLNAVVAKIRQRLGL